MGQTCPPHDGHRRDRSCWNQETYILAPLPRSKRKALNSSTIWTHHPMRPSEHGSPLAPQSSPQTGMFNSTAKIERGWERGRTLGLAARSCDGGGEREVGKEAADPAHCRGGYTSKGLRKRSTRRRAMGSEGYAASRRRRRHSSPSRNLRGGGGGNAAACRQTTRVGHQDTYLKTAEYVSSACSRGETVTTCSFQKEKSLFYPQEIRKPP